MVLGLLWNWIIDFPLRTLYLNGPSILGYGWWEGLQDCDICAQMTGVGAEFWSQEDSQDICQKLIQRKVFAFEIGNIALISVVGCIAISTALYWRWFIVRPFTRDLKAIWNPAPKD